MFCPQCSVRFPSTGGVFCPHCGHKCWDTKVKPLASTPPPALAVALDGFKAFFPQLEVWPAKLDGLAWEQRFSVGRFPQPFLLR